MTTAERARTVAVLYEWAAWCEANPEKPWWLSFSGGEFDTEAFKAAIMFAEEPPRAVWYLAGPEAAIALCLAVAMVAAGDEAPWPWARLDVARVSRKRRRKARAGKCCSVQGHD